MDLEPVSTWFAAGCALVGIVTYRMLGRRSVLGDIHTDTIGLLVCAAMFVMACSWLATEMAK